MIEVLDDENTLCCACRIFQARCLLPAEAVAREGAPLPMCWMCAHLITHHGETLETAGNPDGCECPDTLVFPAANSNPTAEGN